MALLDRLPFSTRRKAPPNMSRTFQFIDHRDGVILNRNLALAGRIYEEVVVSEAELSRAVVGRQFCRRLRYDHSISGSPCSCSSAFIVAKAPGFANSGISGLSPQRTPGETSNPPAPPPRAPF
jgi:hypothetical protein